MNCPFLWLLLTFFFLLMFSIFGFFNKLLLYVWSKKISVLNVLLLIFMFPFKTKTISCFVFSEKIIICASLTMCIDKVLEFNLNENCFPVNFIVFSVHNIPVRYQFLHNNNFKTEIVFNQGVIPWSRCIHYTSEVFFGKSLNSQISLKHTPLKFTQYSHAQTKFKQTASSYKNILHTK